MELNELSGTMRQSAHITTLEHRNELSKREKFIRRLLLGSRDFNPKISAELGIRMTSRYFTVILVRIKRGDDVALSDIPDIIYAIRNIGEELYGAFSECYGAEFEAMTVGFLLNHGSDFSFIREQSQDLKRHIVELFGLSTTLAFCTSGSCSPEECSKLYKNARTAMLYRLSFKPFSIINYDDTLSMSRLSCEYPSLLEREIFECVQSRDEIALSRAIGAFIGTIDNMSYDTIVLHTARLLLAVDGMIVSEKDDGESFDGSIIEALTALESIDDLIAFVEKRCKKVMKIIQMSKSDTKKDFIVLAILKYINENYTDSSLSVEVIAANVNRSSNYIRSIFKKSQGISISEYLTHKRFDQVCKMLIETNLTARDIGQEVGLNSGSYFYTSFKKYTGLTPDAYRKAHRAQNFEL